MLANGNGMTAFNSFKEMPLIPYKILETLITEQSESAEMLWKLLQYPTLNALDERNLTEDEKYKLIWKNESQEQDYSVFMKPLVGSSLDTALAQTQLRLFRYNTLPINRLESIICFEFDIITNEKTSMVYWDGMLCERVDLLEMCLLDVLNGRDLGIGSGVLEYNREFARACQSLMSINNSKSLYGRAVVMAMFFCGSGEIGVECG